jgi:hypothetical protein
MSGSEQAGSSAARLESILQSPGVPNSLLAGKNAGNFGDSAFFRDNSSRKHSRIQQFAAEFPTRPSRELIRASSESDPPSREFAQTSKRVKIIFVVDKKIINKLSRD